MANKSGKGTTGSAPKKSNVRNLHTKVKTARGRKLSSTLWLERQLNDPYVQRAKLEGYASRAAYKLLEMDDRYELLKRGSRVIDLGAAQEVGVKYQPKEQGQTSMTFA